MKAGSLSPRWKIGVVFPVISLLLACATGLGRLPEARAQATPAQGDSLTYTADQVDEPVQIIAQPEPHYPKALQDSLISARVVLRFVVDTTGHVDPNSFRVVSTTHEGFVEAAQETMLKSIFRSARLRGRPVRLWVQQAVGFRAAMPMDTNDKTYTMNTVDEPVQIISEPEPHYPKELKDSLITARLVLRYIVDATGHAEPNSFGILEHVETNTDTTHESFVEAAKKAILKSTFRPARFQGHPVRQLVEQKIRFNIRP